MNVNCLRWSRFRRVKYPTGFTVDRSELDVKVETGRIRLEIERVVCDGPNTFLRSRPGDIALTGSFTPIDAVGVLVHESLPVAEFRGNEPVRRARKCARQWITRLGGAA